MGLGILPAITSSTGRHCDAFRNLAGYLEQGRIRRWPCRQQRGRRNLEWTKMDPSYLQVWGGSCPDALHELTTDLRRGRAVIAIGRGAVANLLRNRHLHRASADLGWPELGYQLSCRSPDHGHRVVLADPFGLIAVLPSIWGRNQSPARSEPAFVRPAWSHIGRRRLADRPGEAGMALGQYIQGRQRAWMRPAAPLPTTCRCQAVRQNTCNDLASTSTELPATCLMSSLWSGSAVSKTADQA